MTIESDLSEVMSRGYSKGFGMEALWAASYIFLSFLKAHSSQWCSFKDRVIIIQWLLLQKDHGVL